MVFDDFKCAERLAGMVRIPTVSDPDPEKMNYAPFYELHKYLEKTYPLVHSKFSKEIVGEVGLLYHWKGTGKSGKLPVLLAAHQDVVPEGDLANWKYPPYEGVIADGYIWGRGSFDSKNIILSHMEALEALIAEGFEPDYDIYLGYGYNEECSSAETNSAKKICNLLKDRGVKLGCVIDEGNGAADGSAEGVNAIISNIWVGEKGYADVEFSITDKGGHSMYAGNTSIIAKLGEIAVELMKQHYPYKLSTVVDTEYKLKAPYMGEIGAKLAHFTENEEELSKWLDEHPLIAYKFLSSTAITMISGSDRSNSLPTKASMLVNFRPIEGVTVDDILDKCRRIAGNNVEIKLLKGYNPTKVSDTNAIPYKCLKKVTEDLNPGVIVAPVLCPGGTDARYYDPVCDNVFRYSGYPLRGDENAHTYDEKLFLSNTHKGPELMYSFLKEYGVFEG